MTLNRTKLSAEAQAYIAETKALHRQAETAMQYHIDAQDAKIKALVEVLENPVRSDDGLYDYHQTDIDTALAAAKETT